MTSSQMYTFLVSLGPELSHKAAHTMLTSNLPSFSMSAAGLSVGKGHNFGGVYDLNCSSISYLRGFFRQQSPTLDDPWDSWRGGAVASASEPKLGSALGMQSAGTYKMLEIVSEPGTGGVAGLQSARMGKTLDLVSKTTTGGVIVLANAGSPRPWPRG